MIAQFGSRTTHHFFSLCIIAILCSIIYSNTLTGPFVFDDLDNIQNNRFIRLTELSLTGFHDAAFKGLHSARPIAKISFALNYYFGRYDVTGYHLVNIAIHIINGILVYFLVLLTFRQLHKIRNFTEDRNLDFSFALAALFAACIFVAHPVQVQSVTYIVQRMNSLATMFFLLSLLLYILGRRSESSGRRWVLWSCCLCAGVLALASKQNTATLPVIILLYEWYFFQDLNAQWLKQNIKYIAGLAVVLIIIAGIYLGDNPVARILVDYNNRDFSIGERVLTQFRVVTFYISLLIFPHPGRLNLLHDVSVSYSLIDPPTTLLSCLFLGGLILLAVYLARRNRLLSFCILWFFINLVIESSVIGLELIFEHRLYLPMVGIAFISSYLLFSLLSKKPLVLIVCSTALIILLGTGTFIRNKVWASDLSLWSDVVAKSPQSYRAHFNLGNALRNNGLTEQAIIHYYKAISISPLYAGAHNNLGILLMDRKLYAEAANEFNKVIRINPLSADGHTNLGVALEKLGHRDEAIKHYLKALRIDHAHVKAHYLAGSALQEEGKLEEAKYHYIRAIKLEPDQPMAHNNLGVILVDQGKINDAIVHFSRAIRLDPGFAFAYFNLAYAQRITGDFNSACDNYRIGLQLNPDNQEIRKDISRYCDPH